VGELKDMHFLDAQKRAELANCPGFVGSFGIGSTEHSDLNLHRPTAAADTELLIVSPV